MTDQRKSSGEDDESFFIDPDPDAGEESGEKAYKEGHGDWTGLSEAELAQFPIE